MQTRSKTRELSLNKELFQSMDSLMPPPTPLRRSQRYHSKSEPPQQYDVSIDFDEASRAWRANKRHVGNGMFVYVCEYVLPCGKKGYKCNKRCMVGTNVCYVHRNKSLDNIANTITSTNVDSSDTDSN